MQKRNCGTLPMALANRRLQPHASFMAVICMAAILSGCQSLGTKQRPLSDSPPLTRTEILMSEEEAAALLATPFERKSNEFGPKILNDLLVAEFAGKQQDYVTFLARYLQAARETRDLLVITRAFSAARFLKDEPAVTELVLLWAEVDPTNAEVLQQTALIHLRNRELARAMETMEQVLDLEGPTAFDRIALHARGLSPAERAELLALYENILQRHVDSGELRYGYAVLLNLNNRSEDALENARKLLADAPENGAVVTLIADLLKESDSPDAAIAFLQDHEKLLLNDSQLGNYYARALIENQNLSEAENVYEILSRNFPEEAHLRLAYALVALENDNRDQARTLLDNLIEEGEHSTEAFYYRARLAELEEDRELAIRYYRRVGAGKPYLKALGRAAFLLIQSDQDSEAWEVFRSARIAGAEDPEQIWALQINLLSELERHDDALRVAGEALDEYPASSDLLYSRAMILAQLDRVDDMERDLRQLLDLNPDDAIALNALGYTLADRTDRLEEAEALIERALKLTPENPAVLDSMGWLLYRQGKPEEALLWLRRAWKSFPDPEIAAHLGEVLWHSGQREAAREVLQKALDQNSKHKVLRSTIESLGLTLEPRDPAPATED